jgi:hypothetical protein
MTDEEPQRDEKRESPPPGDFVSDDLRAQTAHFLEELKRRLRRARAEHGPRLGPPNRSGRE